jgi:alpha-1,3-mannosyltransferase
MCFTLMAVAWKIETKTAESLFMRRPRILHVVRQFWPSIGGVEEYVDHLAQEQVAEGARVFVLTLNRVFGNSERLLPLQRRNDIIIMRVPFVGYRRFFAPLISLKLLKRFDLIHVHEINQCVDTVGLLSFLGTPPFVCTSHGLIFHTKKFLLIKRIYFSTISRLTLSRARFVFSVSKNDQNRLARIKIKSPVIRNPVRPFDWMYRGGKDFLYVGRLSENKDIERLIPFVQRLRNHKLNIVGSGDEKIRDRLKAAIKSFNLESVIRLHGYLTREELQSIIAQCGFAVSAARYEGFGMAIVEAMSAGLLPVVQQNEAFREICRDSGCGLLVDFKDSSEAASKFMRWQENSLDEERSKARDFALSTSFGGLTKEIGEYYRFALAGKFYRTSHCIAQRPESRRAL